MISIVFPSLIIHDAKNKNKNMYLLSLLHEKFAMIIGGLTTLEDGAWKKMWKLK